ncbi:hypothetical protein DEJ28_02385 [Curtobacterium sp. MCPF17_002]|uniref:hypothetical protein n=1 Tax=Curtobacterium sp. MCPF17_002 TaxID=2175645 RepID=UPI000DA8516E|nr:hypothetical protein [Curtobacterium sp. MCPF17_002]WIB77965.1 hypothetical protein DEJ28_02385 [Curtobacterium sp. MCPF17_002]
MKRIIYAGGILVTGTSLADAVLRYAEVLAPHSLADTVEISVIGDAGAVETVSLVVGPASQLVAQEHVWEGAELEDAQALAVLQDRILALSNPHPEPIAAQDVPQVPDDL